MFHKGRLESLLLVASVAVLAACGPSGGPNPQEDAVQDIHETDFGYDHGTLPDSGGDTVIDARDSGIDDADVVDDVPDVGPDFDVADAEDDGIDSDAADVPADPGDAGDDGDIGSADDGVEPACEDDGLECTVESRGDDGVCVSTLMESWCLIDDVCYGPEAVHPDNRCLECAPLIDPLAWTVIVGRDCDDGLKCTTGDVCGDDGICAGVAVACPDDGNSCTVEACSPDTGSCFTTTLQNGAACQDDLNECTIDRCQGGTCVHAVRNGGTCSDGDMCTYGDACDAQGVCRGNEKVCVDDGNVCTENGCDPLTGNCVAVKIDDNRKCEDYNWCTLNDGCRKGVCTGDLRDCSDPDPCTFDTCVDGPAGYCSNEPVFGSCEDGNLCTRGETCNIAGICEGGQPIVCDDDNKCTDDSCDPAIGCVFTPNYSFCDDGNPCTSGDLCDEFGACVGEPIPCSDDNDCTSDYCFLGTCRHDNKVNGIDCDDGDVCTTGGKCNFGSCVPSGDLDCNDNNPCTVDLCDPVEGCYTEVLSCDDGNPCTDDSCDSVTGCRHDANTAICNDGDACTDADRCSGKQCKGTPLDCSDGDTCTLDKCADGICSNPPNIGACDDGNACTTGERCFDGVCMNGSPVDCYDGSDCTADSCNPASGCVNTPISGSCDDGTVCTLNDQCSSGICVGTPINCNDGNFCTNDLCHPLDGCYHENNALLCDDGNPCSTPDQCGGGTCNGQLVFRNPVIKGASFVIGADGYAGSGLDVDENAGTCLPSNKCDGGIDNAFASMALMVKDQFNPDLVERTASGDLAMFLEPESPGPVGSPFEMKMFFGHRTAPETCNPLTSGCNYLAFKADTIGSCTVKYAFGNASTASSHISAGGKTTETVVYFMIGSYAMPIALKWARIEADVTISGNSVVSGSGVIGGVINKVDFKYALQAVPDAYFSPYTKSQVILNVDQTLPMDADADSNGVKESSSIGFKFTIVQGNVVGRDN